MMISVEEALNKILSRVSVLNSEKKTILDSIGQVLAEDIISDINVPPLDNSSMDGYALRAADTAGAAGKSPKLLKVTDTVLAGDFPRKYIIAGTAIRIMTGAAIPEGADSVIRFEDTDASARKKDAAEIGLLCPVKPGQNIRRAGEDITKGSRVLTKGTVLNPAHAGVLASLGRNNIQVTRRPKVAILATGNELTDLSQPLPAGKLYNSNTYSLAAMVKFYGGIPEVLGIAQDRQDSITDRLRRSLEADILITTGGVSMGDYDLVRDVMKESEITFWSVRMKPGKPVAFGSYRSGERTIPHLGLPGNPVSAMITFELFARPAMLKMMGKKVIDRRFFDAIMEDTVTNSDNRRVYARAIVEKRNGMFYARTTGPQSSGVLTSMSEANGLVIVPEDRNSVKPGDKVSVIMLDWCGDAN
jgi:molybdopterin molybdotransferase